MDQGDHTVTITKSFEFAGADHEKTRQNLVAEVKVKEKDGTERVEKFDLRDDLDGIELLQYIAASSPGPGSTRGVIAFLQRIVKDDDWDRFEESMRGTSPQQIGNLAGDLIDAYSAFPTTVAGGSSSG